ncbi:MAG TPA: hypothetical protein PLZ57_15875 [Pseudobdellovibrionaceae bacterium]|nr:hypothetical protein [Pseudobdellovibrionaceae bacterium]
MSKRQILEQNCAGNEVHPQYTAIRRSRLTLSSVILSLGLMLGGSACVSVKLGDGQAKRSEGVNFAAPSDAAYQKLETPRADAAWKNAKNGNTIAFQSACGEASEAPLEAVAQELLGAFDSNVQVAGAEGANVEPRMQRRPFDGREAIDLEADGKVDGVATRMRAILYRKNGCSYVLTQIGRTQSHASDREIFEKFTRSFRAP